MQPLKFSRIFYNLFTDSIAQVDIAVTFIGAFLGFMFALLVELIISTIYSQVKKKEILHNILDELRTLRVELSTYEKLPPYFAYDYCIWNTISNSGDLLILIGTKHRKLFLKIYALIVFADKIEKEYFILYNTANCDKSREMLTGLELTREEKKNSNNR